MLETYSSSCESGIILVISYLRIINYTEFKCIVILQSNKQLKAYLPNIRKLRPSTNLLVI